MKSSPLHESDLAEIVGILGTVATMPPVPDQQRVYLMGELATLLGTDTWVWGVAPLLHPGKQPVYLFQNTGGFDEGRMTRFLAAVEHEDSGAMTTPLADMLATAGSQVTRHLDQIVERPRFDASPARPLWQAAGIGHILITLRPVCGYGISCVGFYRAPGANAFTERDVRLAHIVLNEVPLLHQSGMPHAATRTLPQLPPRCRLIMNQLVRGQARNQIAAYLGLSVQTVNGYVKQIYAHFRVHSQSQLIARFSSGDGMDGDETLPDVG